MGSVDSATLPGRRTCAISMAASTTATAAIAYPNLITEASSQTAVVYQKIFSSITRTANCQSAASIPPKGIQVKGADAGAN